MLKTRINSIILQLIKKKKINDNSILENIGIDSLTKLELLTQIEKKLKIKVKNINIKKIKKVKDVYREICNTLV